jgi:hypothetical protein
MLRNLLILLALLVVLASAMTFLIGSRSAHANEASAPPAISPPSLIEQLGRPARQDDVRALVAAAMQQGEPDPALLAETLGHAGGWAAHEGLMRLLDHRHARVRISSLRSLERLGLRGPGLARRVHRIVVECEGDERRAAITALGVVGDGRDVDVLLFQAKSESADDRRAAFHALRSLTKLRIPPVWSRWAWQWKVVQRRVRDALPNALAGVDEDPDHPRTGALVAEIGHSAWANLPLVEEYIQAWFQSEHSSKRRVACELAGMLRLTTYVTMLESTREFAFDERLKEVAEHALTALGHARPQEDW